MRTPILTPYHGELLNMRQLETRLRIGYATLARWRRAGRLSEAVIDRHIAERELLRVARERARSAGIADGTRRMRLQRGWSVDEVAAPLVLRAGVSQRCASAAGGPR